jgi:beta-galactosidase
MQAKNFNQGWQFHLEEAGRKHWFNPAEIKWRDLDLPHDWSIELERSAQNPCGAAGGFFPMGRGEYRRIFTVPDEWHGKKVFIEFEGVYMNAEVRLNEHFIERHPYGYTSFLIDLTPYLKFNEENTLRVVVDNGAQRNSRWYSGSGIYRPVWLIVADPMHVAHWGVYVTTPVVTTEKAQVRLHTKVQNETDQDCQVSLHSRLVAPDGSQAGHDKSNAVVPANGQFEFLQDIKISTPSLWSLETPALYQLETEVVCEGRVRDTASTIFGIRSLEFSPEKGFLLNDQPLKLKGGCVHHDNGILGAESYARSEERKVEIHKASGFNAIRCAHNPPAPAFLEACDRLGMLVIDEAFDCWRDGKNPYDYHISFDAWWQMDIDSMLYRDRNHPSIILWSIGNELLERDGRSKGGQIARMLAGRAHEVDPSRPVTAAMCGSWDPNNQDWSKMDEVFSALDVGGYNYQWRQYVPDHEIHPKRMMVGTESFPGEAFDNWMNVLDNSYVLGDFVWTSLDYLGEAGIGRTYLGEMDDFLGAYPWHQANCGDLDLCGFKRPPSYYRDILWENQTKLYIAVHSPVPEGQTVTVSMWGWPEVWPNWTWPGEEGKTFKIDVYSACEKVELFLNGQSLGVKPTTKTERFMASFEVPYAAGELKAVGFVDEKPAAEYVVKTASTPAQIRLTPDRSAITAEAGDLCYVTVEILDQDGQVHPAADRPIFFTVKGEGVLGAVGNANPLSTERYRGNQRQTYRGRCLVVLKSIGEAGSIHLRAQADGLDSAEIVVKVS